MQSQSNNPGAMPQTSGMNSGSPESSQGSKGITSEVRSDAKQLGETAKNRLHSELDARKGTAATQVRSVSSAIDRAADELDNDSPQWLKSTFQQGAQQIQRFADTLEQKDSREIVRDIQTMARERPGMFLAGCAALGFAAARVFKAGADGSQSHSPQTAQKQFPPVQGDEPMFRGAESGAARSTTPAGEFA